VKRVEACAVKKVRIVEEKSGYLGTRRGPPVCANRVWKAGGVELLGEKKRKRAKEPRVKKEKSLGLSLHIREGRGVQGKGTRRRTDIGW